MEYAYIVYAKTDSRNRITAVNSSAFLDNVDGWIEIDKGNSQRHHHAQGNYFEKPIYDDRGIAQYKLMGGQPVERTREEMDADWVEPVPQPDQMERIAALEEQIDMLLSGVTEDE